MESSIIIIICCNGLFIFDVSFFLNFYLSRINVAGRPSDLGAQFCQSFDENLIIKKIRLEFRMIKGKHEEGITHGRLGVDVSTSDNFGSFERPVFAGPFPQRHNSRHFCIKRKIKNKLVGCYIIERYIVSLCFFFRRLVLTLLGDIDFLPAVSCLVDIPDAEIRHAL